MGKSVVLGVTGSVAAFKACELVSLFIKKDYIVYVIMTKEAQRFVSPLTFQALTGKRVYTDMFESYPENQTVHISLAKEADILLIVPATANIIAKLSCGICDDLLTCTVTATKAPVLLAPAMNEAMFMNNIVQKNIAKLKKIGMRFVGPRRGWLACGYEGVGCLEDIEEIFKASERLLRK